MAKEPGLPLLKTLGQMGSVLIKGAKPWVHQLQLALDGQLDHYARHIEQRLIILGILGFTFFLSVLLLGSGLLLMVIDYGGVPRGVACLCGGILGLVVLLILMQFTKQNRGTT